MSDHQSCHKCCRDTYQTLVDGMWICDRCGKRADTSDDYYWWRRLLVGFHRRRFFDPAGYCWTITAFALHWCYVNFGWLEGNWRGGIAGVVMAFLILASCGAPLMGFDLTFNSHARSTLKKY